MSRNKVGVMKTLKFRKATVADVVPLSGLIQRTIRVSNAKDYDQKSIDMLCAIFEPEPLTKRIENEAILLCFAGANLVGTVGLKGDYLRSLFVDPAFQGQGLGKVLTARIEEEARQREIPGMIAIPQIHSQEPRKTPALSVRNEASFPGFLSVALLLQFLQPALCLTLAPETQGPRTMIANSYL